MHKRVPALVLAALLVIAAAPVHAGKEPEQVVVQHVLISYKGRIRGKEIDRTKKQAQALAEKLLERAQAGEDFDALVKEYTDDSYPGIYTVINRGVPVPSDGFKREQMARRFGDVAFKLEVGGIGLANYHPEGSPYGYHIIKRLE